MTNAYDLIDKELTRLHDLLKFQVQYQMRDRAASHRQYTSMGYGAPEEYVPVKYIWDRIERLSELIAKSYSASDKELQTKLAELALLGDNNETVPSRKSKC